MFCEKCGTKLTGDVQFCHICGKKMSENRPHNKINEDKFPEKTLPKKINSNEPMTREEYMAHTNIKSIDEAKKYYSNLKALFILVFIGMVFIRGFSNIDEGIYAIIWLADIALIIYFVVYCVKVIKAEKISKASAALSIFFAPISWFWFYPDIMEPLKIILGKKIPPHSLPSNEETEAKRAQRKIKDKKFWRIFWIIIGVIGGLLLISLILTAFFVNK